MELKLELQDTASNRWAGWHILTVAESGFSMLDIYGRNQHGLDIEVIRQFADRVNARDEAGSLHPIAPISAVPRRFFREHADSNDPAVMNDFRRHILEFLVANQTRIHAQRILIDFHVSPASVPPCYVDATEAVVRLHGQHSIQEVVIFR
jgi:hypothetical protein